jgi:glycosyltransferase involved in cell wall biosynthesis
MNSSRRALVATIKPGHGGVAVMIRLACETLRAGGLEPVIAHYEPYSISPTLSVPFHAALLRRPGQRTETALGDVECHAIGSWLPELEFTQYRATPTWRRLIDDADVHLVASGNCLAGTAFASLGVPFVGWVATGWDEDRRVRAAAFPPHRRLLDRMINGPIIRRLEREILSRGHIVALSHHTKRQLHQLAPAIPEFDVLPISVDIDWFEPAPALVRSRRIGFAARYNDPRKNVGALIDVFDELSVSADYTLCVTGDDPGPQVVACRARARRPEHIQLMPLLDRSAYRSLLQSLDVFVIPSDQEGLCIAALEAMACGCPVVSTRCGGPEEFVLDDETGYLSNGGPVEIAMLIRKIADDRALRARLGANARQLVAERYTAAGFEQNFWQAVAALPSSFPARVAAAVRS